MAWRVFVLVETHVGIRIPAARGWASTLGLVFVTWQSLIRVVAPRFIVPSARWVHCAAVGFLELRAHLVRTLAVAEPLTLLLIHTVVLFTIRCTNDRSVLSRLTATVLRVPVAARASASTEELFADVGAIDGGALGDAHTMRYLAPVGRTRERITSLAVDVAAKALTGGFVAGFVAVVAVPMAVRWAAAGFEGVQGLARHVGVSTWNAVPTVITWSILVAAGGRAWA